MQNFLTTFNIISSNLIPHFAIKNILKSTSPLSFLDLLANVIQKTIKKEG